MKIPTPWIVIFCVLTGISNSHANEQNSQWGEWETNPNYASQSLHPKVIKPRSLNALKHYGSGIAGVDENLLHELDQSSLLDYQTQVIEPSIFSEFPIEEEFATGIQNTIEDTVIDDVSEYE